MIPLRQSSAGAVWALQSVHGASHIDTARIVHPGYRPWTVTDIPVRSGACGVITTHLNASLWPR